MKKILTLSLFIISSYFFSQESVCDCVEVGIQTIQSIERGASEETLQKRFEKQNQKCEKLSQNMGADFEKNMASCDNFPKLIQLMAGGQKNVKKNSDVCTCVDISIQILEEISKGGNEENINKLYQEEVEFCDELNNKLGEEQFGLQMMNCENFKILMEFLMTE